jgi:DNA-binding transcriptional ArsR family regulator
MIANKLSAAEIVCLHWAHINSSPERPCRIRLEQIAMQLDLAADTVSRAIKHLIDLGLIVRERQGRNLLIRVPDKFPRQVPPDEKSTIERCESPIETAEPLPLENLESEPEVKSSFEIGSTLEPASVEIVQADQLSDRNKLAKRLEHLGIWVRVGLALINRHGLERVSNVYEDVTALQKLKKVENPAGLIQHALRGGYDVAASASKPPVDNLTPSQIRDIAVAALISQSLGQQISERQQTFIDRYKAQGEPG